MVRICRKGVPGYSSGGGGYPRWWGTSGRLVGAFVRRRGPFLTVLRSLLEGSWECTQRGTNQLPPLIASSAEGLSQSDERCANVSNPFA